MSIFRKRKRVLIALEIKSGFYRDDSLFELIIDSSCALLIVKTNMYKKTHGLAVVIQQVAYVNSWYMCLPVSTTRMTFIDRMAFIDGMPFFAAARIAPILFRKLFDRARDAV